jgi:hypothetical protein
MENPKDIEKIRTVLHLARAHINQQQPDLAIAVLRPIRDLVESYPLLPEWAEYPLTLGEALSAKHSEDAEGWLEDAQTKIAQLPEPPAELQVRLHDRLGYCYERLRRPKAARRQYERGKSAAIKCGVGELIARFQLKMICIDLRDDRKSEDKLVQSENFQTLRQLGHDDGLTCEEQLAIWLFHCGEVGQAERSAIYARGMQKKSRQYFLDLLQSVRDSDANNREQVRKPDHEGD